MTDGRGIGAGTYIWANAGAIVVSFSTAVGRGREGLAEGRTGLRASAAAKTAARDAEDAGHRLACRVSACLSICAACMSVCLFCTWLPACRVSRVCLGERERDGGGAGTISIRLRGGDKRTRFQIGQRIGGIGGIAFCMLLISFCVTLLSHVSCDSLSVAVLCPVLSHIHAIYAFMLVLYITC